MVRFLAVCIMALAGCGGPKPVSEQAQAPTVTQQGNYQAAPMFDPMDYHMPPDSRDRFCPGGRGNALANSSYDVVTKATTSYYCF
jgi:hypothetical protein